MIDASKYALVDLHLHVDGSLTPADVVEMARMGGVVLPTYETEELRGLLEVPKHGLSLKDYLSRFRLPLSVMQNREAISYAVSRLICRLHAAGLIYAELRFAPQQHVGGGLTQAEVVAAAVDGLREGLAACNPGTGRKGQPSNECHFCPGEAGSSNSFSQEGIVAQLILCCMRGSGNEEANRETARLAAQWLGQGVCAADLAGAEADFPTAGYRELFAYVRSLGVPFTLHAGEAAGPESVMLALDYGASRIGHGIRCHDNPAVKARLRSLGVPLEICPTSNLDTRALPGVTGFAAYPLQDFIRDGVSVTINTDNMSVSATTLSNEFAGLLGLPCGAGKRGHRAVISESEAAQCVRNAISAAFLPAASKAALLSLARQRMQIPL